jgi:hypothetical protein
MLQRLPEGLSPELVAQARENPSGELAWRHPTILEVVASLATHRNAILGGDVMHAGEDGTLDYYSDGIYCGNWYLNPRPEWSWADYVAESVAVTRAYIEAYIHKNGDAWWFVLVFRDEAGFAKLPRPQTERAE